MNFVHKVQLLCLQTVFVFTNGCDEVNVVVSPLQGNDAQVVAIWPQPWASLRYEASAVSVTLGEQLPVLSLVPPAGDARRLRETLKPRKERCVNNKKMEAWRFMLG